MFVDQGLCGIAEEELGNDQQTNVFLTIESFLENVASITVCGKFHDASPARRCKQRGIKYS
jgi:hypothetical protein